MSSKRMTQRDQNLRQLEEVKARLNIPPQDMSDATLAHAWGAVGRRCALGCPSPDECKEALRDPSEVPNLDAYCPNASFLLGKAQKK